MLTEDSVREDYAKKILQLEPNIINNQLGKKLQMGTGQLTTFNQLGFSGELHKPDGWYLPANFEDVAIILEAKAEDVDLDNPKWVKELIGNCNIVLTKYKKVVGILYNYETTRVFLNNIERTDITTDLQNKTFYLKLFDMNTIDKNMIFNLTKRINDNLHTNFGVKNLNHRMIFTACALVAQRYGARLERFKGMDYDMLHTTILSQLNKSLIKSKQQNHKLNLLVEVYSEIKMNRTDNQKAIDDFIDCVVEISEAVNSDYWRGEDVMGIFFNEFNRYKGKSDAGQVFTPEHITSLMYRLIDVHMDDYVLDAACGSGGFLVKAMSRMIDEAGGVNTDKAKDIKANQLYGIEFDREIYALACANMMIHKDGKTNLEQLDTRSEEACDWIKNKMSGHNVKVLMNPPYERKYGCMKIVTNVLDNVPLHTKCAFILPDKKLEKDSGKKLLKNHRLEKIIKLPENVFSEGVTTSIFIFESGVPQNNMDIFTCYIEDDGLETVKNQGRQDIKNKWQAIENKWVDIIRKQSGHDTCKWVKPSEALSYQVPQKPFEISEEDFKKTMMDYLMFQRNIDVKDFNEKLLNKIIYGSDVSKNDETGNVSIILKGNGDNEN